MLLVILSFIFALLLSKNVKSVPIRIGLVVPAAVVSGFIVTALGTLMAATSDISLSYNSFGAAIESSMRSFLYILVLLYFTRNAGKPKELEV